MKGIVKRPKNQSLKKNVMFAAAAIVFSCGAPYSANAVLAQIAGTAISAPQLTDITPQVSATTSGFVYNRATKLYTGTMTITNTGTAAISGSIAISLNNLTSGVTMSNAGGLFNGFPYAYQNVSLNPGASTSIPLQFSNPSNARINFTPVSYQVAPQTYLTTKMPYHPYQAMATYEAPPAGFSPVFTELVTRHGSRGASSFDATVYNMYLKAQTDGALTTLGEQFGPDIMRLMKAHALLGAGVPGISNPGYGNLTQLGIGEQKQLADRLLQRLPDYFAQVAANGRQLVVASSGVDRAVDSSNFFTQEIAADNPSLAPLLVRTAPLTAYPAGNPVAQAAGVNRFQLYFHKLAAATDKVTSSSDPYYQTYQDSLAYQAYGKSANLTAKINAVVAASPDAKAAARAVLERLFTSDFVNKIDTGVYKFSNNGSYTFTTDDGSYTATVTGDNKVTVQSLTDAASAMYGLYVVAPAMKNEANVEFTQYLPDAQAAVLAYQDDIGTFYQKGPGIAEDSPVTYKMAQSLVDDFFNEVDAIANGNLSHGAKLRFTHAEEILPLASIFGLKNIYAPVPLANNYTWDNNPWRGDDVGAMSNNAQWDVYGDGSGNLLVKMLFHEKETDFKADCDQARYAPGSHFYNYSGLKSCYNHMTH